LTKILFCDYIDLLFNRNFLGRAKGFKMPNIRTVEVHIKNEVIDTIRAIQQRTMLVGIDSDILRQGAYLLLEVLQKSQNGNSVSVSMDQYGSFSVEPIPKP